MELLLTSLIDIKLELKDEIFMHLVISIFHFEISGIIKSESHPLNILFIFISLFNFQFEIEIKVNNEQFSKITHIYYTTCIPF